MFLSYGVPVLFAVLYCPGESYACRKLYVKNCWLSLSMRLSMLIKQFSGPRWEKCKWHCLHHNRCNVVTYDPNQLNQCLLLSAMCSNVTQASPDAVTLALAPLAPCLQWRPLETKWPDHLVVVNEVVSGGADYAVGWLISGSRVIPAKYDRAIFKTTYEGQLVTSGTPECLFVHPECTVLWVSWSSTAGDALPSRAIAAGHLENGVPLCVAKAWLTINGGVWVLGYYNPETEQAHLWFGSAIKTKTMDVLVLRWCIGQCKWKF